MNRGKYIFSQVIGLISYKKFQTIVNRHFGDYKVRDLNCWKKILCMDFRQLTQRQSFSDTVLCLKANANKMYHFGIGEVVAVSTITRANESRSFQIYEDLAMLLIQKAKQLYRLDDELELALKGNVFAIDATTIDLCLSSFCWATFRTTKGGIKLHTQLNLKTAIPKFILFFPDSVYDVNVLNIINFEANSFYRMDREYVDYKSLYKIHTSGAFFVTRAKDNMNYRRLCSHPTDIDAGVLYDQSIILNNYYALKNYPVKK